MEPGPNAAALRVVVATATACPSARELMTCEALLTGRGCGAAGAWRPCTAQELGARAAADFTLLQRRRRDATPAYALDRGDLLLALALAQGGIPAELELASRYRDFTIDQPDTPCSGPTGEASGQPCRCMFDDATELACAAARDRGRPEYRTALCRYRVDVATRKYVVLGAVRSSEDPAPRR